MFAGLILAGLAQAAVPATAPVIDPRMARMAALYDEVCLKAFPDDKAVDTLMAAKGATALTPEQVKVTLVDDPGRGWTMKDDGRSVYVFLELPPYHACSVRWPAPSGAPDWTPYRAVADPYTGQTSGWATMPPMNLDRGDIHIVAKGQQRALPSGGGESLLVIDQTISDPKHRAAGETGTERRFVHQIKEG